MTKFNPENKPLLSYGEALRPAMEITDKVDAEQYLRDYIAYTQAWLDKEPRKDNATVEEIAKANLGYFAGYYGDETREQVERLFNCVHPIFGKVLEYKVSAVEAFELGKKLAKGKEEVKP